VQAFLFQDGGVTALGANVFNMGLIGTFGGYYLYRTIRNAIDRNSFKGIATGAAIAAWTSVVIASLVCAVELAFSGTVPLAVALSAMATWHVMIGIGEAVITVVALSYIYKTRPDMLYRALRPAVTELPRSYSSH
ncbi:energy-coupling factor ABC transporter permease, partial [Pseudanabaenaceae cyanobacterium LEGE 13415]|nr:energy-coupling factor ABC transporter permease [Pseudanabaenaceae cyanobacterium LEGE 13415]